MDTLPPLVLTRILSALPVDSRARAACVSRAWRAALADPSLWTVLDLSPAGGVAAEKATPALLLAAAARAAGQLRVLDLDDEGYYPWSYLDCEEQVWKRTIETNSAALRVLRLGPGWAVDDLLT